MPLGQVGYAPGVIGLHIIGKKSKNVKKKIFFSETMRPRAFDDDDCFEVARHRGIVATPGLPARIRS